MTSVNFLADVLLERQFVLFLHLGELDIVQLRFMTELLHIIWVLAVGVLLCIPPSALQTVGS